jgi:uncharacterized protein YgfB (UPF0149 family)
MGVTKSKVEIVGDIINDLRNRCGLGNEWDTISEENQSVIRQKWEYIVEQHILNLICDVNEQNK